MTKPTSIKLDPELKARVEQIAKAQGRSTHGVLREAVAEYVASEEEARASFLRDAREAWEEYQRTGEYVSAEDAEDWLMRLARGENPPLPPVRCD